MPSPYTFTIGPIRDFVVRWTNNAKVVVDPFSANSTFATITNDLNPDTKAKYHMLADEFCHELDRQGVVADAVLFDPPYSPRQISECYKSAGLEVGMKETQSGRLYKTVRDGLDKILKPAGVALSFGWNSSGFGKGRGYEIREILIVAHGGAHNDTICVAEVKR